MTDGPTGIQVAPTEDEMNHVQDVLKRAINAIVGMSQLQADVDMLRETVSGLQSDTEKLRHRNDSLDEALYQARTARNELEVRLSTAENERAHFAKERDEAVSRADLADSRLNRLMNDLDNTQRERDDAQLRVMELEDELKAANAKLDTVRSLFAQEPTKAPEPVPQPSPTPVPIQDHQDERPTSPAPTRHYLDAWQPGVAFDFASGRYYTESA